MLKHRRWTCISVGETQDGPTLEPKLRGPTLHESRLIPGRAGWLSGEVCLTCATQSIPQTAYLTRSVVPWHDDGMTSYVQASPDWCTGTISGAGIDGYRVNTFRPSTHPQAFDKGPLDGQHFPTREAATEAMCKAGLLRLWLGLHPTERITSSRYRRK